MKKIEERSLTEGPILQALAHLAIPIMASSFLGTAYSLTDMAWIGTLGSRAVAGVGVGGMYVWLSSGVGSLARMGGQVYAAQCMGKGEKTEARNYAAAALQMTVVLGLLYAFLTLAFTDPLLRFFQVEDAYTLQCGRLYMQITCGLIVFSYLNMTLTGLYTAQGDSKTPFQANLIGLVLNMLLDPALILGIGPFPRLETTGAALATVLAQIIVTAVLVLKIVRSEDGENILKQVHMLQRLPQRYFREVARVGIPTALQGSFYCAISMVLTRMVAVFGSGAVATQRVGGHIESLTWNTAEGFGSALNAFCGQNYGAGKMDRVRKGYRASSIAIGLWGLLIAVLFLAFPKTIAGIFFHEPEVVLLAADYLVIIGFGEALMCVELIAVGAISGLGNTKLCSVISIVLTGLRIPLAMLLSRTELGLNGIWWALTLTSILKGCVLHLAFYRQCRVCESRAL